MFIVDAHLDLAYNVMRGRDVTQPARSQPTIAKEIASVGLPDLREGHVGLICATIFCQPQMKDSPGYRNSDEAHAQAKVQLKWYHQQFATKSLDEIRTRRDLRRPDAHATGAIILLEGGDAIRNPADVLIFFEQGVRIVGLAWKRTRYAGGTADPGPLSAEGKSLIPHLDRAKLIHDISHLSEYSFYQLLDLATGPIMASHSNCRAIVGSGSNRHLTDDMIKAIIERGGIIGINFCDHFLVPHDEFGKRRATLDDVVAHIRHINAIAGDCDHVGIGTDMDGGLGREQIPIEIKTSADLPRVGEALLRANFSADDVEKILGANWMRFFEQHLPS